MKKSLLVFLAVSALFAARAQDKIKYYFNRPVDNSVSTGVDAIYLQNTSADTLVAYMNRAKYSMDICLYDFEATISYNIATPDTVYAPMIAAAINNAYNRGVKIRYIYEASNANTGLGLLNPAIPTLGSPQGSDYTIMHNKFVIFDAKAPDPSLPTVWTGCMNWYAEQLNWDYNNLVVLQDSALAYAYTAEFNMMWGDTGMAPDLATSKFGQFKTDLGLHNFVIGGVSVELYFSPSDHTDTHIQSSIESANTDLYVGMYTFTEETDANDIVAKYNSGVYVSVINDSWSNGDYPTNEFNTYLGSHFKIYNETDTSIFHNKFMIVDPSNVCSDPQVLTGSHNWTSSANTKNDENTLIIHDASAANQFYQYFKACFNELGGNMTAQTGCPNLAVPATNTVEGSMNIFPNPSYSDVTISYTLATAAQVSIDIYNITGQQVATLVHEAQQSAGDYTNTYNFATPGIYMIKVIAGNESFTKKVVITE